MKDRSGKIDHDELRELAKHARESTQEIKEEINGYRERGVSRFDFYLFLVKASF